MTRLSVYCSTCSRGYYKTERKTVLDENQPRKQAGFRKVYSAVDHLQTINQLTEKCNEFHIPLYIGYIDYGKAFDSIEHEAILKEALRTIDINETYVTILEDIYTRPIAGVHMNNQVSEKIPMLRGVRHGNLIFPKLLTATIQEPSRSLRSSNDRLLRVPRWKLKSFGYRSFSYQGPVVRNSLPTDLKLSSSLSSFKFRLKTHLFKKSYSLW